MRCGSCCTPSEGRWLWIVGSVEIGQLCVVFGMLSCGLGVEEAVLAAVAVRDRGPVAGQAPQAGEGLT